MKGTFLALSAALMASMRTASSFTVGDDLPLNKYPFILAHDSATGYLKAGGQFNLFDLYRLKRGKESFRNSQANLLCDSTQD